VGLHSNWSKLSKRRKYALFVRDRDRIYGEYSTDACSRVLVVAEVLQKAASEKNSSETNWHNYRHSGCF